MRHGIRYGAAILLRLALLGTTTTGAAAAATYGFAPAPATLAPKEAPVIVPLPASFGAADAQVIVQARASREMSDFSVTLWARGQMDHEYHDVPMSVDGGLLTARLGAWPTRGTEVRYFIEAKDAAGRSALTGDRTAPFVAQFVIAAEEAAAAQGTPLWWKLAAVAILFALSRLGLFLQRFRRNAGVSASTPRSRLAYPNVDLEGSI